MLIEHLLYTAGSTFLPVVPGSAATPQVFPTETSADLQTGGANSHDPAYEEIGLLRHHKVGLISSTDMCSEALSPGKSGVLCSPSGFGSNPCFGEDGCCAWVPTCWELWCRGRKLTNGKLTSLMCPHLIRSLLPNDGGWQSRRGQSVNDQVSSRSCHLYKTKEVK